MMLGFGLIGLVGFVLVLGLLLVGGVWIGRGWLSRSNPSNMPETQRPRELLDERYARGEISRADYELMQQDLTQ